MFFTTHRPSSNQKTDWQSVFSCLLLVLSCSVASCGGATAGGGARASTWPAGAPSHANAPRGLGATSLERLDEIHATRHFCQTGPEVAVARGRALLASAGVTEAATRPNPTLLGAHDRSLTGERDHETVVGIEIPISLGGKRGLMKSAAAARQAQIELESSHQRLVAALSFRRAFVRASLARARLDVLQAQQDAYEFLVKKLERLEGSGENAQLDRDRLLVEAELSAAGRVSHELELTSQMAWLETVLDASVELTAELGELGGAAPPADGRTPATNPAVAALEKAAEASRIEADAARRKRVPDVDLFAGYRVVGSEASETGHGFSLSLSVPLTLFDHGQAEAQRAEARAAIASAKLGQTERQSRAERQAARQRLTAIAQTMPRLKKAVELAKKTENGAQRLYLAGEGELLAVMQATRSRTELELLLIELAGARADAIMTLVKARGRFAETELGAACNGAAP